MLIRDSATLPHERVIDRSVLCELLHPDTTPGAPDLACSIAHAIVPAGEMTLPHVLASATELYYILDGTGLMHIDSETQPVRPGQIVVIPPESVQFIENTGTFDLVILCVVSPKWQAKDERLVTAPDRKGKT
ncbi:MAG: cupin domain-containing protein [Methanoregula sp.]